MKCLSKFSLSAVAGLACLTFNTIAAAGEMTYTAFTVTDVSLGGHKYHNAQVRLKWVGDDGDIQALDPATMGVGGFWIQKGTATLQITSAGRRIHATFVPGQLFVSVDTFNGGVGFGSLLGGTVTPAYPLAVDGATVVFNVQDLVTPGSWSGHAWSCIGFPLDPVS
jgi:hypothetical protein